MGDVLARKAWHGSSRCTYFVQKERKLCCISLSNVHIYPEPLERYISRSNLTSWDGLLAYMMCGPHGDAENFKPQQEEPEISWWLLCSGEFGLREISVFWRKNCSIYAVCRKPFIWFRLGSIYLCCRKTKDGGSAINKSPTAVSFWKLTSSYDQLELSDFLSEHEFCVQRDSWIFCNFSCLHFSLNSVLMFAMFISSCKNLYIVLSLE